MEPNSYILYQIAGSCLKKAKGLKGKDQKNNSRATGRGEKTHSVKGEECFPGVKSFCKEKKCCWSDHQNGWFHYVPLDSFVSLGIIAEEINFLKQRSSCHCCLCM